MAAASLQVEPRGSVLLLTIDRPHVRNALDPTTLDALSGAIEASTADPIIRAIVLAGAGGACFSAGMDLRAVQSGEPGIAASIARFHDWMRSAERPPIVAAVQGLAVGGGFELMLMCDLAVVADAFHAALAGRPVTAAIAPGPLAVRGTPAEMGALVGQRLPEGLLGPLHHAPGGVLLPG